VQSYQLDNPGKVVPGARVTKDGISTGKNYGKCLGSATVMRIEIKADSGDSGSLVCLDQTNEPLIGVIYQSSGQSASH